MPVTQLDELVAVEAIKRLKIRSLRSIDDEDWARLRDAFVDDVHFSHPAVGELRDADELVEAIRTGGESVLSIVHHLAMPDIEVHDPDNASGTWSVFTLIDFKPDGDDTEPVTQRSWARYYDRYRRDGDGNWKISVLRYEYRHQH